ncbi:MAG: LemA family protein [Verrucomicrobia bacterium]|nr:LemA family protein [Verrucomicrobiota bacterium]
MPMSLAVLLIVLVLLPLVAVVFFFNRLVLHRNRVNEAWSGVDVQLKRRHDLIPQLVAVVKGYAAHEQQVLDEVTRVRTEGAAANTVATSESSAQHLSQSLRPLLALAEAYPELKANQTFGDLHTQLVAVEDALQMSRRYYNGTVRDFNNVVEMFPGNLVAGPFGFQVRPFFEIETATERLAPQVALSESGAGNNSSEQR